MSNSQAIPVRSLEHELDKDYLWGNYTKSVERREKLALDATRKALDMGLSDDVNVSANKYGFGWKELAVIAALLLGGAYLLMPKPSEPTPTPQVVQPQPGQKFRVQATPSGGEPYTMDFQFTADGQLVPINGSTTITTP